MSCLIDYIVDICNIQNLYKNVNYPFIVHHIALLDSEKHCLKCITLKSLAWSSQQPYEADFFTGEERRLKHFA